MRRVKKTYIVLATLALLAGVFGIGAVLMFRGLPLEDGLVLADGRITVVADGWGPMSFGAYLFELKDGGYGLIDSTGDEGAAAIRSALERRGGKPDDVFAVFITHGHEDHTGGIRSFSNANVYVLAPDAEMLKSRGIAVTRGLMDGELVNVSGTSVEVLGIPGHTPGSAAYLVHGVLFLGDSAAAARDGSVAPNPLFSADPEQNRQSLRNLAQRLGGRQTEIRNIAFGHQGAVTGLGPLLEWASSEGN